MPSAKYKLLPLPLRLTANQFLHFALLRAACVIPRLQRFFRLVLLAGGAFGFLAFFFAEFACICHNAFLILKFDNCLIPKSSWPKPAPTGHTSLPASLNRSEGIVP